jgi:hypothetical protein
MNRGRIRILTVVAVSIPVLAVALALAPPAVRASLWLTYDPPSGSPGTTVSVRTGGIGAFGLSNVGDVFPLYLVLDGSGNELLRLGTITVDGNHDGSGTFVVPDVAPGEYGSVLRCEPCAEFSAGRTLLPMGLFSVLSAVPSTATRDKARPHPTPTSAVVLAAWLVATAIFLVFWPRRERKRQV